MGQIAGKYDFLSRVNLKDLSTLPTPAAGEHILVSPDNSMNAAGQGNFDCYIVGDGTTAATALELHKFKAEELEEKLYGATQESLLPESTWFDDNVFNGGYGSNTDKIYFDSRNVIDKNHKIKQFKIYRLADGTMRVYFLKKSDYSVVTYKEIVISTNNGVHTYDLTLEDEYYNNGEMIVGIYSSFIWGNKSGSSGFSTTSYEKIISTGVINSVTARRFGYGIVVEGKIQGDIDNIQDDILELQNADMDINSKIAGINGLLYETKITPTSEWINGTFSANGGGDAAYAFFDERTIIPAGATLDRVRMKATGSGDITIYLLKASDYSVLSSESKSVVAGINDVTPSFNKSLFSVPTYIAIGSASTIVGMRNSSTTGEVSYTDRVKIADGTINTKRGYVLCLEVKFTSLKTNSISQDLAEAIAQGGNDIVLGPYDYNVTEPIVLTSGMTIRGSFGKTRLILSDGCVTAISASNANDIKISDLEIVGTCPTYSYEMNGIVAGTGYDLVETEANALALDYMGTEKGIYLYYCENVVIDNIKINHINGSAIRVNHTGMDYIKGLNACNLFITNCYNGIYCENEHEFSQYTNFSITLCMIGIYVSSGNLIFTAGHVTRCRVAMQFVSGTNHAHGIVNGVELKHNQIAGLLCSGVTYGEFFEGLYISYSPLLIRNSTGLYFDDIVVGNMSIDATGSGGVNKIGKLVKRNSTVALTNTETLTIIETVQVY